MLHLHKKVQSHTLTIRGHNLGGAPAATCPPRQTPAESQRNMQLLEAPFKNLAWISALHPWYFFSLIVYLFVTVIHAGEMVP